MKGVFPILAIAIVLLAAGGLYALKHRVEARRDSVQSLERQILRDSEAIRVLKAEWAYLTSLDLLQERAQKHLSLVAANPEQIAISLARLPFRGRRLLAEAAGQADSGALPRPKLKPAAPPRPHVDAARLLTARDKGRGEISGYPSKEEDFAARIRAVLERMGDEGDEG